MNSKGRAYTQRVEPKLALVEVELPKNAFTEGWEPTKSSYLGKKITLFIHYLSAITTRNLIYGDTILVEVKKFATIGFISPRLF